MDPRGQRGKDSWCERPGNTEAGIAVPDAGGVPDRGAERRFLGSLIQEPPRNILALAVQG